MSNTIRVICISNEEGFAKDVYEYLYRLLEKQQQFPEGKNLRISRQLVKLTEEDNEIYIDKSSEVPDGMIKWILDSYLSSDSAKLRDYGVTRFEDMFTIGRMISLDQMGLYSCELCNYTTLYKEQVYGHRMMHYFGAPS